MVLVVDIETSDLLKPGLPLSDSAQPWVCEIAALLCSPEGIDRDFFSTRIRADGRTIRDQARAVHGIGSREAGRSGVSEVTALGFLIGLAAQATICVGHNIEFDRKVIEGVLLRRAKDTATWVRPGLMTVCTMTAGAPFCRLSTASGQSKYPTLDELLSALSLPHRPSPHTAWGDVQATKAAYFALRARNVLEAVA